MKNGGKNKSVAFIILVRIIFIEIQLIFLPVIQIEILNQLPVSCG